MSRARVAIALLITGPLLWLGLALLPAKIVPTPPWCSTPQPKQVNGGGMRAVILSAKKWPNGSTVRVKNLDGTADQFRQAMDGAREWCQYANLNVVESTDANSEIRVTFQQLGAWSFIGNEALTIPVGQPTMNLGVLNPANARHEFGHGLIALVHEQNGPPAGQQIAWNKPQVYADNAAVGWNQQMVDENILFVYSESVTQFTALDRRSIMMYPIPSSWTTNGFSTPYNTELSWTDKVFASQQYPGRWTDPRIEDNKRVLAALRSFYSQPPPPGYLAWGIAAEVDMNGDGFNDVLAGIHQRIAVGGRQMIRTFVLKLDGTKYPLELIEPLTWFDH